MSADFLTLSIESFIPISRQALILSNEYITPSIETVINTSKQALLLPTERLNPIIEIVSKISRQDFLLPTEKINTNIDSQEVGEYSPECQTRSSLSPPPVPMHPKIPKANTQNRTAPK